jgi:soluble lytic murein transglycosylase
LLRLIVGVTLLALLTTQTPRAQQSDDGAPLSAVHLTATVHPPLPGHPSQYWLVPDPAAPLVTGRAAITALANLVRAIQFIKDSRYTAALPLINPVAIATTPLGAYGYYYQGVTLAGLQRYPEADVAFAAAAALKPSGALSEALPLRIADVALTRDDAQRAVETLRHLDVTKADAPAAILLQTGRAAERAGDRAAALKAYRKVYYEYPLTAEAADAQSGIERLETADLIPADRLTLELSRAEQLFAAKRWAQSRPAFDAIARGAQGDEAELAAIRIAECDYYLDRFRAARDRLEPYLKGASREAEARFFYLTATAALGGEDSYVTLARRFVADFPESPWTEETLNNLASYYIRGDQDDEADLVFRELSRRFPRSRYTERASWKVGWRAYRTGDFREAAEIFEHAAATFPRSDYRPSWIYWAGRARDQVGEGDVAASRYRLTIADYENSYYGRLAAAVLSQRNQPATIETVTTATTGAASSVVPTDALIRELGALGLFDEALREVQYAQHVWGNSPPLEATVAWIRHNQGLGLSGTERFNALRGAITTMRRAYPQFLAAGGEDLPPEILRIIFPLDFWPLITKYAGQYDLDPYLMAALMAQESTFTPEIRSAANAYGLLQLIPSTARAQARKLGMRYSSKLLTQPEANIRMGMRYFSDLVEQFGGVYFALASYNGGKVEKWRRENPDLPQDEFIDDIPYPETQNYVKRILGTAEDYRRLYGSGLLDPNAPLRRGTTAVKRTPSSSSATSKAAANKSTAKKSTAKKKATTTRKKAPTPKRAPARKR